MGKPSVVAINMGYGHLRAAHALASYLQVPLLEVDQPPLADEGEQARWSRLRHRYERLSQTSQIPVLGTPLRGVLDFITGIPRFYPSRDLSQPNISAWFLDREIRHGLGQPFVSYLQQHEGPMVSTFFAPAIIADRLGASDVYCVVTDSDVNRVWAPADSRHTRITYFAPSQRVRRRLRAYGVPAKQIIMTGFPLPHELLGGVELPALKSNLAQRIRRLDTQGVFRSEVRKEMSQLLGGLVDSEDASRAAECPQLTFAVGGTGAQAGMADRFLPSLSRLLYEGKLRLCLVAGTRAEVAEKLQASVHRHGLESLLGEQITILAEDTIEAYFTAVNKALARTDLLWTKPSEMTFFGALGIPLICSAPVGTHERYNRRWVIQNGVGFSQQDVRYTAEWLQDWMKDGTLAAAAWSGFVRMPKHGLYQIAEQLGQPTGMGDR